MKKVILKFADFFKLVGKCKEYREKLKKCRETVKFYEYQTNKYNKEFGSR